MSITLYLDVDYIIFILRYIYLNIIYITIYYLIIILILSNIGSTTFILHILHILLLVLQLYYYVLYYNVQYFNLYYLLLQFDCALPYAIGLQDTATIIATSIIFMHDIILYYLIVVLYLVLWKMYIIFRYYYRGTNYYIIRRLVLIGIIHGNIIELVWTITPGIILLLIAIPTYKLLYIMDMIIEPVVTVKAIGRQWYWQYEYDIYSKSSNNIDTDTLNTSYNIDTEYTNNSDNYNYSSYTNTDTNTDTNRDTGAILLGDVDIPMVLPIDMEIRLLTTSGDVIHSLAVPSLGVKGDAIPGRLNGVSVYINRTGSYYGQCSELCGVNHGYMPINIVGVDILQYIIWLY